MIPKLNENTVCITTEKNYILAAIISSYFNGSKEYFTIFNLPDVKEEDDHLLISRIVANRHKVYITNNLKKLKPRQVILAGLSDFQKSLFKNSIPKEYIVEISDIKDVEKKIKNDFQGEVVCKEQDLLLGLYIAKQQQKLLKIDNDAKHINLNQRNTGGLVAIENTIDIDSVIAVNYAIAIDSDIAIIPKVNISDVKNISRELNKLNSINNGKEYKKQRQKIRKSIIDRLSTLNVQKYDFITFFTKGIPYGYGISNIVPTTHVLIWTAPYFIFDNIYNEKNNDFFYSSMVFSPESFDVEETKHVIDVFTENKYYVKPLIKADATVNNFEDYVGYSPYDVLHICSHGGEVGGYYTIKKF